MVNVPQNLKIFNMAYTFVLEVYKILPYFPDNEKDNIVDQLRRAATSLPLNIAEGCGAKSDKLFMNYLNYAYTSAKELNVLLLLSRDLKYIEPETFGRLYAKLDIFMRHVYKFMTNIEKSFPTRDKKREKFYYRKIKLENNILQNSLDNIS